MNRPKVIVIQEASIDGKLAISPDKPLLYGDERWESIRGKTEFNLFKTLVSDHEVGATLEGSNSFVPKSHVPDPLHRYNGNAASLYQDYLPENILNRVGHRGWFIAVDSRGRVRWMYKDGYPGDDTWIGWHAMVLVARQTPIEYLAYLQKEHIPYLVSGDERVDFGIALEKIKSKLGVKTLISTAGGMLNGALLQSGLVDEIHIEFIPAIIGGHDAPSLFSSLSLSQGEWPTKLELVHSQTESSGRLWVYYKVVKE